ncbi:Adenylate cyclase type 10 [Phytophthora boehmeriae]|uniref:Adenylate cyclase type 10 n=1 Tax=Phytophthora boehmeriae TaxID=109152 RepID=A0A8T1WTY6_9STRA|nr:Adenylate cyclase type 10 [Phytophthora boehmeriae]
MVEHAAQDNPEVESRKGARDRVSSGMLRKELDMRLTAYLPAVVRRHLERQDMTQALPMPTTHRTMVVSMFADVSGFTAMTESLAARGPVGAEDLAKHLNSYFEQLLRLVSSAGGDVFKFAGDAMLIFWPESKEDTMDSLLRRALQCALRIQSHLHEAELARGVVLSVKVGVGIGEATIAHLGGESDGATTRIEYVAVGPALEQAFSAEHQAEAGDVICSIECWKRVRSYFDGTPVQSHGGDEGGHGSGFHKVTGVNKPVKICSRRPSFTRHDALLHKRMKQYVSRAVWPYLDAHDEFWGSELRDVTVLFINLGFSEQDLAQMLGAKELQRLQDAFAKVQKCVYDYEGTINKFLVDDKGSTVIAAFGLPPVTHENDPVRGILASLAICAALGNTDLKASVGITTGTALCGVVGHQGNRREYTVLGDIVNLSARLMQRAKSEGGGVITDAPTKIYTQDVLHFEDRLEIMVKGKNESIKIHRPYPRMSTLLDYHLIQQPSRNVIKAGSARTADGVAGRPGRANAMSVVSRAAPMQNLMENMHRVQVRDAQRRLSLRADRQCLPAEVLVESESFKKVRTSLLEKCSHLNPLAPGGAFVLEGDIGVGKTVLLRSALASPEAGDYQVFVGTASPFSTRKPYAIWSELITRGAMELSECEPLKKATTQANSEPEPHPTTRIDASREVETERRKCVAHFVRQKIREGAAPNTTLVRFAPLLNATLDTDFDAYPGITESGIDEQEHFGECEPSSEVDDDNNNAMTHEETLSDTNQHGEAAGEEIRTSRFSFAESHGKNLQVKEEEIASWFLGLLENDLPQQEEPDSAKDSLCDDTRGSIRSSDSSLRDSIENERESEWRPNDLDLSGILLLCALHAMSRERVTVFCLDSAMYMDEKSWILVTIVAKYFTNCLVVIGTRPPSLALGENTESSSFRKQLRLLKQMSSSTCEALETFCSDEIEILSRQILKVPTIPKDLLVILFSRSQGNPLFLHEIIAEMREQEVIEVDQRKGTCALHVQTPWGDKFKAQFCFSCHLKFHKKDKEKVTTKTKKHRCKCCGYVFCPTCTPKACFAKLPGTCFDLVRHCRTCYNLSSSRRPSGGSAANTSDKRVRTKDRIRNMFHSDKSGEHSSSSSTSSLSPSSAGAHTLTNRIALRPPRTVKSVLTTMLDQLTVSQRMLMKTASAIGPVFDKEMLRGTCPIEAHLSRFAQDLEDLEQLAMVRRIDNFIGVVPASVKSSSTKSLADATNALVKVKFEFNHGFMRSVIRNQMLRGQLDKLNARIADFREQQQKELRHRFFAKANESLTRPQLVIPSLGSFESASALQRSMTPTQAGAGLPRSPVISEAQIRRNSQSSSVDTIVTRVNSFTVTAPMVDTVILSSDSSESSTTQVLVEESEEDDSTSPVVSPGIVGVTRLSAPNVRCTLPTIMRLKAGRVFVKKQSSVFSHLKLKGLKNARQWKTRYAVLQNVRLFLQYEETEAGNMVGGSASQIPLQQGNRQGTSLFLKGAKVRACDPEVAAKVNCFQVEVSQWTKGKYLMDQRRAFVIAVESEAEVENWVYMIRYAIESLENQPANQQIK